MFSERATTFGPWRVLILLWLHVAISTWPGLVVSRCGGDGSKNLRCRGFGTMSLRTFVETGGRPSVARRGAEWKRLLLRVCSLLLRLRELNILTDIWRVFCLQPSRHAPILFCWFDVVSFTFFCSPSVLSILEFCSTSFDSMRIMNNECRIAGQCAE